MESMIRTLFYLFRVLHLSYELPSLTPGLGPGFLAVIYLLALRKLLSGLLAGFWLLPPYRPPLSYPVLVSLHFHF